MRAASFLSLLSLLMLVSFIPQAGVLFAAIGRGWALDAGATVARLVIGGTTDTINLDVGNQTLTITGTGTGDELDLHPLGRVEIGNGTVSVADVRNDGLIVASGNATLQAASILNNNGGGIWVVSDALLTVDHPSALNFRTAGTLTVESGGGVLFGPNAILRYQGGTIVDTGVLLFTAGSELVLDTDLLVDGPTIALLEGAGVDARYVEIDSDYGHRGPGVRAEPVRRLPCRPGRARVRVHVR